MYNVYKFPLKIDVPVHMAYRSHALSYSWINWHSYLDNADGQHKKKVNHNIRWMHSHFVPDFGDTGSNDVMKEKARFEDDAQYTTCRSSWSRSFEMVEGRLTDDKDECQHLVWELHF